MTENNLGDDNKCKIYSHPQRPPICKNYPLELDLSYGVGAPIVRKHKECPAINKGVLNDLISRIEARGAHVIAAVSVF